MSRRLSNKLAATGRRTEFRPIHKHYPGPIHSQWREAARRKGFEILGRINDRYTLDLRCNACGGDHASRVYTVMKVRPLCPHCLERVWRQDAQTAGLEYLHRDHDDRHYSHYQAPCSHVIRRQHGLVSRMARGEVEHRCEICQQEIEAYEARKRGWTLIGADPDRDANYRLYRHDECGSEQSVARINMQTGRFGCSCCGEGWAASRSYLYAMIFRLRTGREVIKLRYSHDPESRLIYQLRIDREMPCRILRQVRVATGRDALRIEKGLHAELRRSHRDAVVDPKYYRGQIRVGSEIYDIALKGLILARLDAIAVGQVAVTKVAEEKPPSPMTPVPATVAPPKTGWWTRAKPRDVRPIPHDAIRTDPRPGGDQSPDNADLSPPRA